MSLKGTFERDFEGYVEYVADLNEGDLKNLLQSDGNGYSNTAEKVIEAADEKYEDEFYLVDASDMPQTNQIKLFLCKC